MVPKWMKGFDLMEKVVYVKDFSKSFSVSKKKFGSMMSVVEAGDLEILPEAARS